MGPLNNVLSNNKEAFIDLSSYIDSGIAPSLSEAIAQYPLIRTFLTQRDGAIRTLPTSQMQKPDESCGTTYWINQAWLTAVNKEAPTNLEELHDVLTAFRDQDPNGNGEKDEIPLSFCNNDWAGKISSLFGPFGVLAPDNHILVEGGKVVFQPSKDGFYEALKYYHTLYEEGLLDAEGFSQTSAQNTAKMNQNILGIIATYDPQTKIGADHDYIPLPPILGDNGTTLYEGSSDLNVIQNLAITVACKKPQVMLRYYDYVNQDMKHKLTWNYGPGGVLWELNADGSWNQLTDGLAEGSNFIATSILEGIDDTKWAGHLDTCKSLKVDRYVEMMQESYDYFNSISQ